MKATVDIPDALYRQVKAKSALEGKPVREVAIDLFRSYVERGEAATAAPAASTGRESLLADGTPAPPWFGLARRHMRKVGDHGMEAVRESIGRGWAEEVAESEAALSRRAKR
jgi:hypothetical protein